MYPLREDLVVMRLKLIYSSIFSQRIKSIKKGQRTALSFVSIIKAAVG